MGVPTRNSTQEGAVVAGPQRRDPPLRRADGGARDPRASRLTSGSEISGPVLRINRHDRVIDSTLVMGVVNASPESFSDRGEVGSFAQRIELVDELVGAGADIIDVGGQSAITNQPEIAAEEELERVVPIVEWLRAKYPHVLVSVDTYKPPVVEATLAAGASIINDVSGLLYPEVVDSCVRHDAGLVVMHTRARPKTRLQDQGLYDDVTSDVVEFLQDRVDLAVSRGLPRSAVIVDPGPDFTKTPYQTVEMLRGLDRVRALGRPVLLALSRKDFLGAITGQAPRGREAATHAAIAYFASTPGTIVRVHDVRAAIDVIATVEVLAGLKHLDPAYLLPEEIRHEPKHTRRSAGGSVDDRRH
jgi:dihydropteroate synthase